MSSFFKSQKPRSETELLEVPYYKDVAVKLSDYLKNILGKEGQEYTGEKTAPMTAEQQAGVRFLSDYAADTKTPELLSLAVKEGEKTLSGDYDPSTSQYYEAFRKAARKNLSELQDNIADQSAGAGRYWTGARLETQSDAAENTTNNLNLVLGEMAERERERRLQYLPTLINASETLSSYPARKAQTLLQTGELERQIKQEQDKADYADFLRRYYDYPLQTAQLASNFQATKAPEWTIQQYPGKEAPDTSIIESLLILASLLV